MKPFLIKKDVEDMPDSYKIKVSYLDGSPEEEIEIVSHAYILNNSILEILTKEDCWEHIQAQGIRKLKFNKEFSKIVELNKLEREKAREAASQQINKAAAQG